MEPSGAVAVALRVNSRRYVREVEPRLLLSDFLRHELGLTGTHIGCEHGVCGACTVLLDGQAVRSCLMLAVQASGTSVTTIEGLSEPGDLHPVQRALLEQHGLQCGFCTPGMILTACQLLAEHPSPSEADIRHGIAGNLCRCTGYQNIVRSIAAAAEKLQAVGSPGTA